ncbi:MAG: hypothetical protein ACJAWV_001206 [Flammeovirgaceae bacterium]|jgi:hypothetical protein
MPKKSHINAKDLQGAVKLIVDATVGVSNISEELQEKITNPKFLPNTFIQRIISYIFRFVYRSIRGTTKIMGNGLDIGLKKLAPLLKEKASSEEREVILAVLNGVVGDYLEKHNNPLALKMQFRHGGQHIPLQPSEIAKALPNRNGKILIGIHGLCMNDLQWTKNEHNHVEKLASEFGFTPIYLHYNSGKHVSENGREFSQFLEKLVANWGIPIESIQIVAHSMGGLISRSALHYGGLENKGWISLLHKVFFVGTPHHGARLERAGNYVDIFLEATPYAKPFAKLGKIRSAGVTDLRYSNLIDEDWNQHDRFEMRPDERKHIPLSENIEFYAIAATKGNEKGDLQDSLIGDGLVTLDSAFGNHEKPERQLHLANSNKYTVFNSDHMDLLCNSEVYGKLREWFG